MAKGEKTSPQVAAKASAVLRSGGASGVAKTLAGSALSQASSAKTTSSKVAGVASKTLDSPRASATSKTLAGSVLTQKPKC